MENILVIISKQEFTSLYRFGRIPNNRQRHVSVINVENELFNSFIGLPFFEGDEEYIIINVEFENIQQKYIYTQNLTEIIPLTKAAKISLSSKFDNKINFKEAIYEHIIKNVEDQIEIYDKIQGAKSLLEMFFKAKLSNIKDDILQESYLYRVKGKKSNEIQSDFFTHLLVYERYDFFPNTDLGYFYDLGDVFAHYKGKDSFKGSNYFNFLERNKQELREKKLTEIIGFIESSDEIDSFKNFLTLDGEKLFLTAVFYLKYKDELSHKDSLKETNLPKIMSWVLAKNFYVKENIDALYLLGGFLGFKRLYDDYYDSIQLRIFKNENTKFNIELIESTKKTNRKIKKENPTPQCEVDTHIKNEQNIIDNIIQPYQSVLPLDNCTVNEELKNDNNKKVNDIGNRDIEHIVVEKLNALFDEYKTDELKLEKEILSKVIEISTLIHSSTKITKKIIFNLINSKFIGIFECDNASKIKKIR